MQGETWDCLRSEEGVLSPDTEEHFVLHCPLFKIKRNYFFGKLSSMEVVLDLSEQSVVRKMYYVQ